MSISEISDADSEDLANLLGVRLLRRRLALLICSLCFLQDVDDDELDSQLFQKVTKPKSVAALVVPPVVGEGDVDGGEVASEETVTTAAEAVSKEKPIGEGPLGTTSAEPMDDLFGPTTRRTGPLLVLYALETK